MVVNLFSLFDPSNSMFSFSLFIVFLPLLFFSSMEEAVSFFYSLFSFLLSLLVNECNQIVKSKYNFYPFHFSLFIIFLFLNISSLSPFIFPSTSHISLVFPIGLIMWLTPVLKMVLKNFYNFLGGLIPQGTPVFLMPFMVLIELVSLMIRPVTLSVRLTANVTAGHLLISILINFFLLMGINLFSLLPILSMLILELGVALIQAYVFFTLLNMYAADV